MAEQVLELNTNVNHWFNMHITRGILTGDLRDTIGLVLHLQANQKIEAFMQAASASNEVDINLYGTNWVSLDPASPLKMYNVPKKFIADATYTLNYPCQTLLFNYGDMREDRDRIVNGELIANLSFLRLVGISRPEGVKVGIVGAYSKSYIKAFSQHVVQETKKFLEDHITSVAINLRITSQS